MIECKGRNGYFKYDHHSVIVCNSWDQGEPLEGFVDIYSNSPHTRAAPVCFRGPPREVVRLLRQIARELEADIRGKKIRDNERGS